MKKPNKLILPLALLSASAVSSTLTIAYAVIGMLPPSIATLALAIGLYAAAQRAFRNTRRIVIPHRPSLLTAYMASFSSDGLSCGVRVRR